MRQAKASRYYRLAIIVALYCLTASIFYLAFMTSPTTPMHDIGTLRLVIVLLMAPIFIKYVIQVIAAPCYHLIEKRALRKHPMPESPSVSVLVPAWNEEVGILKTIQSILNTHYEDLELIVINDGSTDRTHELVSAFIQRHNTYTQDIANSARIKYLNLKNGGKAKALNEGLKQTSGEFVMTIDADSIMDRNAITKMLKRFGNKKVGAVAGNVIVGNRKKSIALLQQLEYLYGFFFKRADSLFGAVYIIGGAAAAYRKSTLDAVGGFDDKIITEDIEMSTRILAHGFETRYAADSVIYTEGPSEWKCLCQQRLRWKYGRLLTFIKHRALFFNRKLGKPYLTFLLLPVAIYAELCLLFEAFLLAIFYGYTIYTNDYLPLACVIAFTSILICAQILFDSKARFHRNILCLAPVAWIVFYVIDAVELQALYRSLKRLIKRQELEWQSWSRVGLLHQGISPPTPLGQTKPNNALDSASIIANIDSALEIGSRHVGLPRKSP